MINIMDFRFKEDEYKNRCMFTNNYAILGEINALVSYERGTLSIRNVDLCILQISRWEDETAVRMVQ